MLSAIVASSLCAGTMIETPGVAGDLMIASSSRAVHRRRWLRSLRYATNEDSQVQRVERQEVEQDELLEQQEQPDEDGSHDAVRSHSIWRASNPGRPVFVLAQRELRPAGVAEGAQAGRRVRGDDPFVVEARREVRGGVASAAPSQRPGRHRPHLRVVVGEAAQRVVVAAIVEADRSERPKGGGPDLRAFVARPGDELGHRASRPGEANQIGHQSELGGVRLGVRDERRGDLRPEPAQGIDDSRALMPRRVRQASDERRHGLRIAEMAERIDRRGAHFLVRVVEQRHDCRRRVRNAEQPERTRGIGALPPPPCVEMLLPTAGEAKRIARLAGDVDGRAVRDADRRDQEIADERGVAGRRRAQGREPGVASVARRAHENRGDERTIPRGQRQLAPVSDLVDATPDQHVDEQEQEGHAAPQEE